MSLIFDSAKGRWVEKFMLPLGTDNILVYLVKASGLQADATLKTHATMATLLSANTQASFTNYVGPKVLSSVDITLSLSGGIWTVDTSDQIWLSAGGASNDSLGAVIFAYRPTSGTGTSGQLPLSKHEYTPTTNGTDMKVLVPSIGTQP